MDEKSADYWTKQLEASAKLFRTFHEQGDKVVKRYLDEREDSSQTEGSVNLFWAYSSTLHSTVFASLPKINAKRRHDDHADDDARVAAAVMERLLNADLEENGKEHTAVLSAALQDRIIPGLGVARVCYDCDIQTVEDRVPTGDLDPQGQPVYVSHERQELVDEWVDVVYYHWRDVAWGWCRTFAEMPWLGFRNRMTRDEVLKRFPEAPVNSMDFKRQGVESDANRTSSGGSDTHELAETTDVWEIWCRETQTVYFHSTSLDTLLDSKPDPLRLKGFFPIPPPLAANVTTSLLMPKADYVLAQSLYEQINTIQRRLDLLIEAVRVVGIYDKSIPELRYILGEAAENDMIPVDNFAMLAEKGGIQGTVDFFPVEMVVTTIISLREQRDDSLVLLERVTGHSDILSGSGTHPREGVGTQQMKAEFGSVRMQKLQQDFSDFVRDLMELKAEVISKHCEPATIARMANVQHMAPADQPRAQQAIMLLKQWDLFPIRVSVLSESMAMVDYTRLRAERTDFLMGVSQFMQSAGPLLQEYPEAASSLLEMLKWFMMGFKGADSIEGVLDQAIAGALKSQGSKADKPDPQAEREKMKADAEMAKIQAKTQADMQLIQAKMLAQLKIIEAKSQADGVKEEIQAAFASLEREMDAIFSTEERVVDHELKMEESRAKVSSDNSS